MNFYEAAIVGEPRPKGNHSIGVRGKPAAFVRRGGQMVPCYTRDQLFIHETENAEMRAWEKAVAAGFLGVRPAHPMEGPVEVRAVLRMPKPLRPKDFWPIVRPDLDKLIRPILDALTALIWGDDSQVCRLVAEKRYPAPGEAPGVLVGCRSLDERQLALLGE